MRRNKSLFALAVIFISIGNLLTVNTEASARKSGRRKGPSQRKVGRAARRKPLTKKEKWIIKQFDIARGHREFYNEKQ